VCVGRRTFVERRSSWAGNIIGKKCKNLLCQRKKMDTGGLRSICGVREVVANSCHYTVEGGTLKKFNGQEWDKLTVVGYEHTKTK